MSSNNDPALAEGPARSSRQSDNLNLRVTYLHAGNPRPPHNVGAIPASTTIGELKRRLEADLLEHPRPEEQRLIYQGRPLMQNDATLRNALRLEGPIGPLPYTIHIIVQARRASSHFRPSQPGHMSQPNPVNIAASPAGQLGSRDPQVDPQVALEQAQRVQAMALAQLNMLQQQLGQFGNWNSMNGQTPGQMPQNFSATIHINGQPVNFPQSIPTNPRAGPPPVPNLQEIMAEQQRQRVQGHEHPIRTQPQMLPPQAPTTMPPHLPDHLPPHIISELPPFPRPSSAPGHPVHRQNAGSDARTVQPVALPPRAFAFGLSPPPSMPHLPHPFSQVTQSAQHIGQPTVWLASSRNGPEALLFAPGHGYFTSQPTPTQQNTTPTPTAQPATTTAPGLAATTAPAPQPAANAQPGQVAIRQALGQVAAQAQPRPRDQAQGQADNDFWALILQRGWLFLRLYMFTFVLSEPGTWRRYCLLIIGVIVCLLPRQNPVNNLFAGARRHIDNLIGPPQPQRRDRDRNRARRRQQEVAPAQTGTTQQDASPQMAADAQQAPTAGPSTTRQPPARGSLNITPEENARRLVREHEQRNPNILRDIFYRMEQAVALFLASLVPGVGERHVAAREEARRQEEQERLEAQRAREEEEKQKKDEMEKREMEQVRNQAEEGSKDAAFSTSSSMVAEPSGTAIGEGSSTGVDTRFIDEPTPTEMRERTI